MYKKFFIRTFGCQMNDKDTELVAGMLIKNKYRLADSIDKADIVLFNTCSVRQKAEDKVWSEIGKLKKAKIKPIIGLIGCMAQNFQKEAFKRSSLIDIVVGPNDISVIPEILNDYINKHKPKISVSKSKREDFVYNTEYIQDKNHANVIIMEGCDNFCSYCIVPFVRGRERSRPADKIIDEIKQLVKRGIKDITLLGQNVNSYSYKNISFIDIITKINAINGLESFDFVTSHPKDATEYLFKAMANLNKCKNFLHLPFQAGSDKILKKMNRKYTRKHYIDLVKKARKIMPDIRLTTDVMVGFPGETKKDFVETFKLMQKVKFDAAYIFKYSPRPHTKAAELKDDVEKQEKKQRNQTLLNFQKNLHKSRKNKT